MQKTIEKKLESFVRAELSGIVQRVEMVNGSMFLMLDKPGQCDFVHKELRTFYKENINPEGGVNMYAVGDEFAFDFVPEDREAPVFMKEDEEAEQKGIWSEFAEEEMFNNMPDDVDTILNLEAESKRGK